jgi:hypothetical protein
VGLAADGVESRPAEVGPLEGECGECGGCTVQLAALGLKTDFKWSDTPVKVSTPPPYSEWERERERGELVELLELTRGPSHPPSPPLTPPPRPRWTVEISFVEMIGTQELRL